MAKYQPGFISQPPVGDDGEIPESLVFNDVGHVMGHEMIRPMGQKAVKKKAKEEKHKTARIGKTAVDMKGLESLSNNLANAIKEASRIKNDNSSCEMWMKQADLYMKMNNLEKAQEFMDKIDHWQQEHNLATTNDNVSTTVNDTVNDIMNVNVSNTVNNDSLMPDTRRQYGQFSLVLSSHILIS